MTTSATGPMAISTPRASRDRVLIHSASPASVAVSGQDERPRCQRQTIGRPEAGWAAAPTGGSRYRVPGAAAWRPNGTLLRPARHCQTAVAHHRDIDSDHPMIKGVPSGPDPLEPLVLPPRTVSPRRLGRGGNPMLPLPGG